MEPSAMSRSVFSALKATCDCSTALCEYLDSVELEDNSVSLLHGQINALQSTLAGVDSALRAPAMEARGDIPLAPGVQDCMQRCQTTVEALTLRVREACPGSQEVALLLPIHEMAAFRPQVELLQSAVTTTLDLIRSYAGGGARVSIVEKADSQLATAMRDLSVLRSSTVAAASRARDLDSEVEGKAKAPPSDATIVPESRSIVHHSSQSQNDIPALRDKEKMLHPDSAKRSTTTTATTFAGSEFGEPLSEEARKRISSWMAKGDAPSVPQLPELDGGDQVTDLKTTELTQSAHAAHVPDLFSASEDGHDGVSDEDEMEIELAHRYLREGRSYAKNGDYQHAQAYFRKCESKLASLGGKHNSIATSDVTLEIAKCCHEQDNMSDALKLVDQLVREVPEDDYSRVRVLDACHLRAQILLRQGNFELASRQCKKTLHSRRRLGGKDTAYFQSVALLATIYEALGDDIEAMMYASFLPSDFVRPAFKLPQSGDRPPSVSLEPGDAEHHPTTDRIRPLQQTRALTKSCETLTSLTSLITDSTNYTTRDNDSESVMSTNPSVGQTLSTRHDSHPFTELTSITSRTDADPSMPSPERLRVASGATPPSLAIPFAIPSRPGGGPAISANSYAQEKEVYVRHSSSQPSDGAWSGQGSETAPLELEARGVVRPTAVGAKEPEWAKMTVEELERPYSTLEVSGNARSEPVRRTGIVSPLTPKTREMALKTLEDHGFVLTEPRDWTDEFFWAASAGHHSVVQLLMTKWTYQKPSKLGSLRHRAFTSHAHVLVNAMDSQKRTALYLAAMSGRSKVVQILLDAGASYALRVESTGTAKNVPVKRTPLEEALFQGHSNTVSIFISNGCYDNSQDEHGWTLLHHAALHGHKGLFDAMINKYPNLLDIRTRSGRTALHMAAQKGEDAFLDLLVRRNAEVNARDVKGLMPLFLASIGGHRKCAEMLLVGGADVHAVDKHELGVLHMAAQEGHVGTIEALATRGADFEACDEHMRRPLFYAARFNRLAALQQLLKMGADAHARDGEGTTALHCAAQYGQLTIVEALISHGMSIELQDRAGMTPLMLAAREGHRGVVMALLPEITKIDAKDSAGMTALQHADARQHAAVKKLLQLNGAAG